MNKLIIPNRQIVSPFYKRQMHSSQMRFKIISLTIGGYVHDVVIDRQTGLMWPKDGSGYGGNSGTDSNWSGATTWAASHNFANFTDWRLPHAYELLEITQYRNGEVPRLFPAANFASWNGVLWTCDETDIDGEDGALLYDSGGIVRIETYESFNVIAVRRVLSSENI